MEIVLKLKFPNLLLDTRYSRLLSSHRYSLPPDHWYTLDMGADYKQAGVDIEEGYRAVGKYRELAAKTLNPAVLN
jgi:hypothetical protein